MADFKTHMMVSTATGAVLGFAGYRANVPWDSCFVAGTLCSVSGMLPDLDSNSGRPLREATAMGAAVVPMLMVDRLQRLDLNNDTMVLIAILSYIAIRFVLAEIFRRYTVHRGMWHSLPAAAICGMVAFLIVSHEDLGIRIFKTVAVVLGFMSHLILDEIWSVDFKRGSYQFKSSFGTAIKLWGNNRLVNVLVYAKILVLGALVYGDQNYMSHYNCNPLVPHTVSELVASIRDGFKKTYGSTDTKLDPIVEAGVGAVQERLPPGYPTQLAPSGSQPNVQNPANAYPSIPNLQPTNGNWQQAPPRYQ